MKKVVFALFIISSVLLAACSSGGGTKSDAPKAVMDYLQAEVSQDQAKLSTLSCKAWEQNALLELDSFQGVTAKLDNPACTATGTEGNDTLVTCTGNIIATYNNENQNLPLSARVYRVTQEGGEWRVCGYK